MRYVPGCLLIDATGAVVARDIDPDRLEGAVEKVVR